MKQKYKVLITGKNKAIIDDIFVHTNTELECLSTSRRMDDVMGHLKYFEPDAFVYCLKTEEIEDINTLKQLAPKMRQSYIPFIIIGDQTDCNEFQKMAYNTADLILTKPLTISGIVEKVKKEIGEWSHKKTVAEAQKQIEQIPDEPGKLPEEPEGGMAILRELQEVADGKKRRHIKLALKFLEKKKTDLILLDYEMPGLKGPEVFKTLKRDPQLSNIPVVFLTGVGELSKVQEVLEMKPQGYLLKPVDRAKLRTCIESLLG